MYIYFLICSIYYFYLLSADKPAEEDFCSTFQKYVEDNHYTLNQIFNCDETGLYYKLMPQKTLASSFEKSVDGRKTKKDRVTINACANASGTIKLPLLMIGKSKNPRCFKHINRDNLPLHYSNQANAWVNAETFTEWFQEKFVPTVQKQLREMDVEPKAVLLLDNCSAHPSEDQLISKDGQIIAKFLPPSVTSLIQPMDQGVLLEELVLHNSEGKSIPDYLKTINVLKVSTIIAACWNEISDRTLRLSWIKFLPEGSDTQDTDPEPIEHPTAEFGAMFQLLDEVIEEDEIENWLGSDQQDMGYAHLNDDEIVSRVTRELEEPMQQDPHDNDAEEEEISKNSHSAAVTMFEGCIQWLQEQEESNVYNISVLQELKELAAKKRLGSLKQKKITDYFSNN